MQTETITALQLFERGLTKGAINNMAMDAVESVLEKGNVLQVAEAVAAMKEFCKRVEDDNRYTDYVRDEAFKHGKSFVSSSGAKIEPSETGTAYHYEECNDTEWELMTSQIKGLTEQRKQREKFLQNVPLKGMVITDTMTGETITIYPPIKTSNSSFKITLAK